MKTDFRRSKILKMIKPDMNEDQTRIEDLVLNQFEGRDFADNMESLWKLENENDD